MRRLLLALLPLTMLLGGCTAVGYDMVETASISPRFRDTKPIDFGDKNPQRHQIHGIDISRWNGDIDWMSVRKSGVSFVFIKATEGKDALDPKFDANWRGASAAAVAHAVATPADGDVHEIVIRPRAV